MADNNPKDKKVLVGLNTDWEDRMLPPGDYRFAKNLHVGSSDDENEGTGENLRGNVQISNANLPAGTNTVIGSYEDKQLQTIIYFLHNDQGNHGIYQFFPNKGTNGEIETLLISSILNFDINHLITGIDVVDGKLLYWTDKFNPQRKINIEKANDTKKKAKINLYFDTSKKTFFSGHFKVNIFDPSGNPTTTPLDGETLVVPQFDTKKEFIDAAVIAFNAQPDFGTYFKASACEEYISLEATNDDGIYTIEVKKSLTNIDVISVPQNFYPKLIPAGSTKISGFKEEFIDALKYPPNCEIIPEYKNDATFAFNFVRQKVFQFRARYLYDDGEKSTLGPISIVPDDKIPCGSCACESDNNYIELDYSDVRLVDPGSLTIIKSVELFVRETNEGKFKSIKVINQADVGILENNMKFFNDGNYSVIDDATSNKLHDAIPLLSGAQAFMKNRLFYGDNVEGYDTPCIDVDINMDIDDTEPAAQKLGTVKGKIKIINRYDNGANYRFNQPIWRRKDVPHSRKTKPYAVFGGFSGGVIGDHIKHIDSKYNQILASGGFIVYLAGTPHYAVSTQNKVSDKSKVTIDGSFPDQNVYDAEKKKKRRQIRKIIQDQEVWSTFTIPNVKPGKYIVRIASHLCSKGDILGNGSIYDLDNGIEWQKTSTYTLFTTTEFVVEVLPGKTAYIPGGFIIEDLTKAEQVAATASWSGYLYDAVGSSKPSDLKKGIPMEKQLIAFGLTGISDFVGDVIGQTEPIVTDHNGFWFASRPGLITLRVLRIAALSISIDPNAPRTGYTELPGGINTSRETIKGWFDNLYDGTISDLKEGNLTSQVDRLHTTPNHHSYILYNHEGEVSESCRTKIEGKIINTVDGKGVAGVSVAITGTAATGETTNPDGKFSINVYADAFGSPAIGSYGRIDNVIISYEGICIVDVIDREREFRVKFDDDAPAGNTFDNDNHYDSGNYNVSIINDEIISSFKRGGKYELGLVYEDRGNRGTTVVKKKDTEVYIPFYTEDLTKFGLSEAIKLGRPIISWNINSQPPEFATHYRWVRTKNLLYNRYLQFTIDSVQYKANANKDTTFGSGEEKEIYVDLSITKYIDENSNASVGYVPEKGDRMRFILDENSDAFDGFFDLDIREFKGSSYVIKFREDLPELKAGMLVELFTPKLDAETKVFYEFGECYKIDNPHTASRAHSVTSGIFANGDVWYRPRNYPFGTSRKTFSIEDSSLSDFFDSKDESIGRTNVEDSDAKQVDRINNIRFSNIFFPGTNVNGLNTFEALDNEDMPRSAHRIRVLAEVGNILLVVAERNTISIYVGESIFTDVAGQQVIGRSDKVIGSFRVLIGDYGTLNPESFIEEKHRAYWWDRYRGEMIRYSQDGLTTISSGEKFKMSNYFSDLGKVQSHIPNVVAWGTFDREFGEYIIAFSGLTLTGTPTTTFAKELENDAIDNPNRTTITTVGNIKTLVVKPETIAFNEGTNRWTTFYSFHPEAMGKVGLKIVSFKGGALWLHNENDLRNTFFDIFGASQIQIIGNANPSANKIWQSLSIESNLVWATPTDGITNEDGQVSDLLEADFIKRETGGDFHAAILRDKNTPNIAAPLLEGDNIRCKTVEILLENNSKDFCKLFAVNLYYLVSELSNA